MVVQAIALLDDLDKEINIYAMRVKVRTSQLAALQRQDTNHIQRQDSSAKIAAQDANFCCNRNGTDGTSQNSQRS